MLGNQEQPLIFWLARLLAARDLRTALAVAWMSVLKFDLNRYTQLSHSVSEQNQQERLQRICESAIDCSSEQDWRAVVESLAKKDPCGLLLLADHVLATQPEVSAGSEALPGLAAEYNNGLIEVKIPDEIASALHLGDHLRECWLAARPRNMPPSRTSWQYGDLHRHLRNWFVLPKQPDANSPSLDVLVQLTSAASASSLEKVAGRKTARTYLGEFTEVNFVPQGQELSAWTATALSNDDDVQTQIVEHLARAKAHRADFVVFPELSITTTGRATISKWLLGNNEPNEASGDRICMVVAGSFHVQQDGEFVNESIAFDAQGQEIAEMTQCKLRPVDLSNADKQVVERIKLGTVLRLMYSSIGLHAILICLDFAQANASRLPLTTIPITWWWVPSLSETVNPHLKKAEEILMQNHSLVACANQGPAIFIPGAKLGGGAPDLSFVSSPQQKALYPRERGRKYFASGPHWAIAEDQMWGPFESF